MNNKVQVLALISRICIQQNYTDRLICIGICGNTPNLLLYNTLKPTENCFYVTEGSG